MFKNMLVELFTSKRFIATLAATIVAIAARKGLQLDEVSVGMILSAFVTYIFSQGLADKGKTAATITAEANIQSQLAYNAHQKEIAKLNSATQVAVAEVTECSDCNNKVE